MAISLRDLVDIVNFKFATRYSSAQPLPEEVHIPECGLWRHIANNDSGVVQTLSARLGNNLLEVKHYPLSRPGMLRSQLCDIWLFDVSKPPQQEVMFHLSERVESGISVGLTSTGRNIPEALIPTQRLKQVHGLLLAI